MTEPPGETARPPAFTGDPDQPSAARRLDAPKIATTRGANGGRGAGTRWPYFPAPVEKVGRRWLLDRDDVEAYGFAERQLERELAEATLRYGGYRRADTAKALGISTSQLGHVLAGRRRLSFAKQIQLGRALVALSLRQVQRASAAERASWGIDFDDEDDER